MVSNHSLPRALLLLIAGGAAATQAVSHAASPDLRSQQVAAWIVALDSDSFQQREQATQKLTDAGVAAVAPLKDAGLNKSAGPELVWRPDSPRRRRP